MNQRTLHHDEHKASNRGFPYCERALGGEPKLASLTTGRGRHDTSSNIFCQSPLSMCTRLVTPGPLQHVIQARTLSSKLSVSLSEDDVYRVLLTFPR